MRTSTAKRHLGFSALLTKRPSSWYPCAFGYIAGHSWSDPQPARSLEDQDSFLDLSPRSDRETGKKDQRIARTETATPAQENEGARALRPVIKVFEVL
jgi:hypothetical protein